MKLNGMFPADIVVAIKIIAGLWVLGLLCFIPFIFFELDFLIGIKIALIIDPFIIFFLTKYYINKTNITKCIKEGGLFGLFIIITHLPADFFFLFLFFEEGLIIFENYSWCLLFYGEMIVFSTFAGLYIKYYDNEVLNKNENY